jgi:hypothetical protein
MQWPSQLGKGCSQGTPQFAPHIQGLRNPPHNKITSTAVTGTSSIHACSRMNSIAETKNNACKGSRFTRAMLVINASLKPKAVQFLPRPIVASRHRDFCKCEPGLQAHSTAPERVPVRQ